jgi:anaerobic magnesium-protoporphyrin IX monomethyl ester cyclase
VIGIGQGYYLSRDGTGDGTTNCDAILLGEPEQEFFRLFDQIRHDDGASASWRVHYGDFYAQGKRFLVEDPDRLPFPSYTPEELRAYRSIYPVQVPQRVVWGFLIATRGCPYKCVFCSEVMRVSVGPRLRSRSASNVADEMEHLARQGVNICSFQDDTFSANRRFVRALCEELIARNSRMPWMARVRVDELSHDLLALMKKAGCVMLGIGVESGSPRILAAMGKREDSSPWLELCRQTFRSTRAIGIGTNAYYVIGNPTETREEIEQTIRFAMELNSDSIQVHFYTPYPGSAAWEKYRDRFGGCDPKKMFHYATPMLSLADIPVEELVKLRAKFYLRYILRPGFAINHLRRHAAFYWHNPDVFWRLLGIRKVI